MSGPPAEMKSFYLPSLLKSSILAAAYYASGVLSLSLGLVSSAEVLVWPPMGIGLAALVLYGLQLWPGILVGSFLLSIQAGLPIGGALGPALAITGESLFCAYLLRRIRIQNSLAGVRDVLSLFGLAGAVSPLTGALAAAWSYCLAGLFPWSEFGKIWLLWWRAEALAILVIAPAFLTWGSNLHLRWTRKKGAEALVLAAWLFVGNVLAFGRWSLLANLRFPSATLPFALRIWAALRFGPRGVTAANMLVVLIAARGTWAGFGPLVGQTVLQSLFFLAAYGISTSAVSMLLAATICERARVEGELRTSEDRYRDLVEHSEDLICTHDLEGRILSVNEAAARILGYEPNEVLKMNIRDCLAPEVRHQFGDYLATIRRDGIAKGLMLVLTKKGERRIWEYRNTLRKDGVTSPIVRGMAHDVNGQRQAERALRESEEKFSKAFHFNPDAMAITTLEEGRFLDVNHAFEHQMGYGREEVLGKTAGELGVWLESTHRARVKVELQDRGFVSDREFRFRKRSGEQCLMMFSAVVIDLGGEKCALGVAQDITERRRVEEELRRLSGRILQMQDEERRRIARDLHDSTGQNLSALASTLDQLPGAIPSSSRKSRKLLHECRVLADQCICEVRTLSYALHPPMLDEVGLEDAIRHYVQGFAKRSGIQVDIEASPGFERLQQDVALALFRVVQESLTNIHRHSGSLQAKIRMDRNTDHLTLEISDRGYKCWDSVPRREGEPPFEFGVGILSMHERVEHIGGHFIILSGDGGTTVRVTLPAGHDEHEEAPHTDR